MSPKDLIFNSSGKQEELIQAQVYFKPIFDKSQISFRWYISTDTSRYWIPDAFYTLPSTPGFPHLLLRFVQSSEVGPIYHCRQRMVIMGEEAK